jgi:toxin YoeB
MEIVFSPAAKEDLTFWVKTGNKSVLEKISRLIEAIIQNPYEEKETPSL